VAERATHPPLPTMNRSASPFHTTLLFAALVLLPCLMKAQSPVDDPVFEATTSYADGVVSFTARPGYFHRLWYNQGVNVDQNGASTLLSQLLPGPAHADPRALGTILDRNGDGWDEVWEALYSSSDGRQKIADLKRDPNGDANNDGESNFNEMVNGTDPWPAGPRIVLSAERLARMRNAASIRAGEVANRQQLMATTLRPLYPPGQAPVESAERIEEWERQKAQMEQERIAAANRAPLANELLNRIAAKWAIPRHGGSQGGKQWSLVGEGLAGPLIVKSMDRYGCFGYGIEPLWLPNGSRPALTGSAVTVGVWEAGANPRIRTSHSEFFFNGSSRITHVGSGNVGSHATAVASTLAGGGIADVTWRFFRDPGGDYTESNVGKQIKGPACQANIRGHGLDSFSLRMNTASSDGIALSNHSFAHAAGWQGQAADGTWIWHGSTNFVEDPRFGAYMAATGDGISCQEIDAFVHSHPTHLPIIAAGNWRLNGPGQAVGYYIEVGGTLISNNGQPITFFDQRDWTNGDEGGYDSMTAMATAKNGLTIGYGTDNVASIAVASASGPTDDGRIKPDVIAVGSRSSTLFGGGQVPKTLFAANGTSDGAYYDETTPDETGRSKISGSSFAAPIVTGVLAQLDQYRKVLYPNGTPWWASTWRALAIASAWGSSPDYRWGFGAFRPDAMPLYMQKDYAKGHSLILEFTLQQGQPVSFVVQRLEGDGLPFNTKIATLAWSDPAAQPIANDSQTDPQNYDLLVNDIDLRMEKFNSGPYPPGGIFYPWVLDPANDATGTESATRRASVATNAPVNGVPPDDSRNNIESISINSLFIGVGRRFLLTVSHKGVWTGGSQKVSLVLAGVTPVPDSLSIAPTLVPNQMALTFRAAPKTQVTLQSSTSTTSGWTDVNSVLTETNTTTVLVTRNPAEPRRFWRFRN